MEQFAQIWHLEFVLRHFIYANLMLKYGARWEEECLTQVHITERDNTKSDLFRIATERQEMPTRKEVYLANNAPPLLWQLTTGELGQIIANKALWSECFAAAFSRKHDRPADKTEVCKQLGILGKHRNLWAHFHPMDPDKALDELNTVVQFLSDPIASWTAEYWNADPVPHDEALVLRYRHKTEQGVPAAVPLETTPLGGYDGGFLDSHAPLDRGSRMLLMQNASKSCYWININAPGLWHEVSIDDIRIFSEHMQNTAMHVAVLFEEGQEYQPDTEGFFDLRVSLGRAQTNEDCLLESLWCIGKAVNEMTRGIVARRRSSEQSGERVTQTQAAVLRELFYRRLWNVIIWPTQEKRKAWAITTR